MEFVTGATVARSIGFDGGDKVRDAQQSLTNPPDAIGAQEKLGCIVHVAKLQVISVGDDVD